MKYCPSCGAENDNAMLFCAQCGTELPQTMRKSGSATGTKLIKIIVVVALILAAVALIMGVFTSSKLFPEFALGRAFLKTCNAFETQLDENTNIVEANEIIRKQLKKGAYSIDLELSSKDSTQFAIQTQYDMWRSRKIISGSTALYLPDLGLDTAFNYSVDRKSMQLAFFNNSFNVYGFRFKDLNKKYSTSFLSKLIPITIPEEVDFKSFEPQSFASALNTGVEDKLKKLKESFTVEYLGKSSIPIEEEIISCKAFRLTWNLKAASEFIKTLSSAVGMSDDERSISEFLGKLEPSCVCYVNKAGTLIGLDFMAAGNQYKLLLTGTANIWDSFVLSKTTSYAEDIRIPGGIKKNAGVTELYLGDEGQEIISLVFEDTSKKFRVEVADETLCQGSVFIENEGVLINVDIMPDTYSETMLEMKLTNLSNKPEILSENYIDIFNPSLDSIQRLLLDIGINLP